MPNTTRADSGFPMDDRWPLWRGSLLPLGRAAAPKPYISVIQKHGVSVQRLLCQARIGRREQVSIAKLHREMSCVTRIRPHGPYVVGFAGLHDGRL